MRGEWLRPATVSTSIIFVHGILSSGDEAWTNRSGVTWPELLSKEPMFAGMGIYIYSYQTSFLSGSYSLDDIVDDLKERLRLEVLSGARRLIFVCHSMGGLIVRKYLVERQVDLIERGIDIGLFLVASPSLGDKYANWLSLVTRNIGHMQVEALRFSNQNMWLNSLDKEFKNLKEDAKLRLRGKELIEDKLFAEDGTPWSRWRAILSALFWRRPIVARYEGARYFGDPYKVSGSDHRTIAKPESQGDIQHRLLCDFISSVAPHGGHFRTLLVIDDEPAVREALAHSADRLGWISLDVLPDITSAESLSRQLLLRPNVDAAIIDLDVPLGGHEIYRVLKQWRPSLPIVVYTRHADHSSRIKQLRTLGVNNEDVVLKQDTSKDLLSMVNRFEQAWSTSAGRTTGGGVA